MVPVSDITDAGAHAASLDDLLVASDIVSLHCPSTAASRKCINARTLERMKAGALLVNVARGDLVDTDALVAALRSGRLAGAALDVCDPEPLPGDHALRSLPGLILAPHIASVSPTAVRALREGAARRALQAAMGALPDNVVNGVNRARVLPAPDARGTAQEPIDNG